MTSLLTEALAAAAIPLRSPERGWPAIWGSLFAVVVVFGAPAHALERMDYLDYGFAALENSAGGSVLDGFVSQRIWADTDRRWLGTQLRIELDQGTIFQDKIDGAGFDAEANHAALAALQPSMAFDTRIGVNGQAPGTIMGGAVNLGGTPGLRTTDTVLDVAFGPGGGSVLYGPFDFGTITLSSDAVGRGALLLSSSGAGSDRWEGYGFFAHLFEIDEGVIRLTGEPIPLAGGNTDPEADYDITADLQVVSYPKRQPEPPREEPANDPPPVVEPQPVDQDPAPPVVVIPYVLNPSGQPPGGSHNLGGVQSGDGPSDGQDTDPDDEIGTWTENPLISLYAPGEAQLDSGLVILLPAAGVGGPDVLDLRPYIDPEAWQASSPLVFYDQANGEVAVPLSAMVETTVADLVASGDWVVRGTNLVFSGAGSQGGVPEPGSLWLALLAIIAAGFWRRVRCASPTDRQ